MGLVSVAYQKRVYLDFLGFKVYEHHLTGYMDRWIFQHPWGMFRIHHILRSDNQRGDCHDHPFDFTSFLLTGGYREVCMVGDTEVEKLWPPLSIVRKRAEDAHRIIVREPLWTLVWTGPRVHEWGFHTPDGWVHWKEYEVPA